MSLNPLDWLSRMSMRWQLICAVACVHAGLMSVFVIGTVQRQRDFLENKTKQHVEFQAVSLADSSQHMVMMNDFAAVEEVLANLSKDSQVEFAFVTDPNGGIEAHTKSSLEGEVLTDAASYGVLHGPAVAHVYIDSDSIYAAAAPIWAGSTLKGWAFVGRNFSDDTAYLHGVILAGFLYTTLAVAVGAIVAVLMANKLTLPLRLLLDGAKRLEEDRLEEPIPLTTENEVRTVTEAFNTAMKRLAGQRNSLRKEVDDRIHAEQELHQIYGLSHRRAAELDAVIQSLPEAVLIGTAQGITKCNARAMSLLNATSLGDLTQPESRNAIFTTDRQSLSREQMPFDRALKGEISVMEVILQRRDTRDETYIRVAAAPVTQNGGIVGAVSVVTDITTERLEQEKLRRAKADAEEANNAKDHFLAVLSHELRTPLTPVLTLAQMLERDPDLPAEAREDVITIRRNVELEARLIDDLLDLTRISRGKVELNFVAVDVHEKIRHVLRMCESEAGVKELRVAAELKAARAIVSGDSTRIQQVLWNLLRNAIKFTRKGDSIAVRTWNATSDNGQGQMVTDRLMIEVADTGIGIEPDALARVFEAFEQGGREVTRAFGGLGLGLTISKAMVDLHHGQLSAASAGKNLGATFTISLPLDRDAVIEAVPEPEPIKPQRRSILLVEDHIDTAKATARLLTQSGYSVQTAASVAQAIQVARQTHFDLIISDIGLPDGTGHDLIRKLVAEGPNEGEHVRGIAISGFGQPADLAQSEDAGFVDHLVKPVNPDVLLHAVDDALQKE